MTYELRKTDAAIFDEWCSFLNFFDSSIHFELSFMNLSTDAESFEKSIRIPFKKDSFNPVRAEYSQMLKKQLAQGNNGSVSYTHLDVYKRQIYDRILERCAPILFAGKNFREENAGATKQAAKDIVNRIQNVSMTEKPEGGK